MKTKVEFKPFRRKDGQWAIEIFRDDASIGFVHWIESTNGSICVVNRADMVMSPIWTKIQCRANCNWLNAAYLRGEIK